MPVNEKSSKRVAAIAAKGLKHPERLTVDEIKKVCASVVTQAPDKPKRAPRPAG